MGYNTNGFNERSIIMSFDVNFNKPIIKEAQSMQNDGGAGNLGYFEQGEKERKNREKSIFSEETDSFKKSSDVDKELDVEFSFSKFIENIVDSIKDWFKKLFGLV